MLYDCADPLVRPDAIDAAARAVQAGQLVVLPTDTVYGLGADAFDTTAVSDLLAAKGRGRDMPVPVLVGSWNTIEGLVTYVPVQTRSLIEAFWPGGLTLVVEHAPSLAWEDRKSTRLNSSHVAISYAVFCLKKKKLKKYIIHSKKKKKKKKYNR